MNFLNKYITKKNLFYVTLTTGGIALITLLMIATISIDDLSSLERGISSIIWATYFYEICFILNIILVASTAYLYFYKKNKRQVYLIVFIFSVIAFVFQLFTIAFIMNLQRLINAISNGNIYSLAGFDESTFNGGEAKMNMAAIAMIASVINAVYFGYIKFVKKDSLVENQSEEIEIKIDTEALKDNVSALSNQWIDKCKVFASTKKGKGIIAGCVLFFVLIITYSIYAANKKTDFDVTKGCEIIVEGVSGNGEAYVSNCELDYNLSESDMVSFVNDIEYEIEDNGNLENGDTVKVVAKYSNETADALKLNVINTSLTKKVKGLIEYYDSLSEIPNSILKDAEKQISNYINDPLLKDELYFSTLSSKKDITLGSKELMGKYFMNVEEDSWYGCDSIVYLYKLTFNGEKQTSYLNETFEATQEIKYVYVVYGELNSDAKENAELDLNSVYSYSVETDEDAMKEFKDDFDDYEIEEWN